MQEKTEKYITGLIGTSVGLKEKWQRYSAILQCVATIFTVSLFVIFWQQIKIGIEIPVAISVDIIGGAIVAIIWAAARACWKEPTAYSLRAGQLQDLLIILNENQSESLSPDQFSSLIMSLRRDGLHRTLDLGGVGTIRKRVSDSSAETK